MAFDAAEPLEGGSASLLAAQATRIRVGTAGWGIPRETATAFPGEGSVLERYGRVFDAVEINTTFRRVHRHETFERWASSVGVDFRFAVKFPKAITHEARLVGVEEPMRAFLEAVGVLGRKLGPLLVQLPPSLAFDARVFGIFCARLRACGDYVLACEPRHASWFEPRVDRWLAERRIARVAADPALHPGAGAPGGWRGLSYYRLHGSPRVYYSAYQARALADLEERMARDDAKANWCIFDNTALGAAAGNALALRAAIRR
ncbi:MAG: DUF72 domain-containing protein [Pseudomonadota bacterium]|nr:DUF72 domain-containing protein [Pseudomonadota bacterium]